MTLPWPRSLWMRLAVISAQSAAAVMIASPKDATDVRQAAQLQFMHAMTCFACATFMNVGARRARRAPACFLAGSWLYALKAYFFQDGGVELRLMLEAAGAALMITGWLVLALAASAIDLPARETKG